MIGIRVHERAYQFQPRLLRIYGPRQKGALPTAEPLMSPNRPYRSVSCCYEMVGALGSTSETLYFNVQVHA